MAKRSNGVDLGALTAAQAVTVAVAAICRHHAELPPECRLALDAALAWASEPTQERANAAHRAYLRGATRARRAKSPLGWAAAHAALAASCCDSSGRDPVWVRHAELCDRHDAEAARHWARQALRLVAVAIPSYPDRLDEEYAQRSDGLALARGEALRVVPPEPAPAEPDVDDWDDDLESDVG